MIQFIQGDWVERLKELPDESVQCCVTSPPYWGLRDYKVNGQLGLEKTPDEYVAKIVTGFREVRRVLEKDGTLWLNLGDSYAGGGRGGGAEDCKQRTNAGSLVAPTPMSAFRPGAGRADGIVDERGQRNRNGIGAVHGIKPKDLIGIPWSVAFALRNDGWYLRCDIIWSKPNPMPESVTDRPTRAHEYIFLMSKSAKYFYDQEAIKEKSVCEKMPGRNMTDTKETYGDQNGGNSGLRDLRIKVRSPAGWKTGPGAHGTIHSNGREPSVKYNEIMPDRNKRSVWTVPSCAYVEAHFATFPPDLIKPCILAGSRPGDTILDPFAGSFTTCAVAEELARNSIGIELNEEYIRLGKERCNAVTPGLAL